MADGNQAPLASIIIHFHNQGKFIENNYHKRKTYDN